MKKAILLFFIVCSISHAQVPSSCTVPQLLASEYNWDIKSMALRRIFDIKSPDTAQIRIPQAWQDTIAEGLAAIFNATSIPERDTVFNLYCIHDVNPYRLYTLGHEILLNVDLGQSWTQAWQNLNSITGNAYIDTLMTKYHLKVTDFFNWSIGDYALLRTDSLWNTHTLIEAFKQDPAVFQGEVNRTYTFGNTLGKIEYQQAGAYRFYYFYFEFHDCSDECDNYRRWQFKVNPDCSVQYQGYTDWGFYGNFSVPFPPPINCNTFPISTQEYQLKESYKIYPNPAKNEVTVSWDTKYTGSASFVLYDLNGRELKRITGIDQAEIKVDLGDLSSGIYSFLVFEKNKALASGKLCKE